MYVCLHDNCIADSPVPPSLFDARQLRRSVAVTTAFRCVCSRSTAAWPPISHVCVHEMCLSAAGAITNCLQLTCMVLRFENDTPPHTNKCTHAHPTQTMHARTPAAAHVLCSLARSVAQQTQLGEFNIPMDKRNVYDWNTRIHLLARGPGIKHGSTWNQPATQVDMAPTFLGLAGALCVCARGRAVMRLCNSAAARACVRWFVESLVRPFPKAVPWMSPSVFVIALARHARCVCGCCSSRCCCLSRFLVFRACLACVVG